MRARVCDGCDAVLALDDAYTITISATAPEGALEHVRAETEAGDSYIASIPRRPGVALELHACAKCAGQRQTTNPAGVQAGLSLVARGWLRENGQKS